MKLRIHLIVAGSLGLTCSALAQNYDDLAGQGYRWVTVDGPFACTSEQQTQQIVANRTDATELQVVENIQCYYLIQGSIAQVIKEDPARGMSEIRFGSIITPLWTYTRFLSKHPVKDTYGVIETPQKLWSHPEYRHRNSLNPLEIVRQLGIQGVKLVFGGFGMVIWRALVLAILE